MEQYPSLWIYDRANDDPEYFVAKKECAIARVALFRAHKAYLKAITLESNAYSNARFRLND